MSYLIKYETREERYHTWAKPDGKMATEPNWPHIRTVFRVEGDEWRSFGEEAKRIGSTEKRVRTCVANGRPTNVDSRSYRIVGGPYDGEWMTCREVANKLNVGKTFAQLQKDDDTGALEWREPTYRRPRGLKAGRNTGKAASLFASLPRTA